MFYNLNSFKKKKKKSDYYSSQLDPEAVVVRDISGAL